MPSLDELREKIKDQAQEFVPFLGKYYAVTTEYGAPIAAGPDKGKPHYGVDFGTPKGTRLYSMGSGVVLRPTDVPGKGSTTGGDDPHTITVDYGKGILVQFSHLDKVHVKPGDVIAEGDWIGDTGDAGIGTGAHLHVAAWLNGRLTDPRTFIDPTSSFTDYERNPGATAGSFPIFGPATGAVQDVGQGIGAIASSIAEFVGAIVNPATWARIFAIIGGALMMMLGGYMLWQST